MADSKISALTGASTPLAGTEVVPIVQSSTTKKVSVADLTAGRAISATQLTISTGNVIVGTSGKGIDFSITSDGSGTMTSEVLGDYEEGTFVPTIVGTVSAGAGTYSYQFGRYTKIGNRVFFNLYIDWSAHTGTGFMKIAGLPFTSQGTNPNYHGITIGQISGVTQTASTWTTASLYHNSTQINLWETPTGGGTVQAVSIDTAANITISGFYQTA